MSTGRTWGRDPGPSARMEPGDTTCRPCPRCRRPLRHMRSLPSSIRMLRLTWNALLTAIVITGCARPTTVEPASPFEVTASLQELMQNEVDPSADAIWDAAGTSITREGLVEKRPRSEEDWKSLRRHALVLLEATNLLVIPGRQVAIEAFPSDGPGVFGSQEI